MSNGTRLHVLCNRPLTSKLILRVSKFLPYIPTSNINSLPFPLHFKSQKCWVNDGSWFNIIFISTVGKLSPITLSAFPTLHSLFKNHYLTQSSHRISSLVSGIISLVSSNATIVLRHHCDVKFVDIQNISVRFFLL